MAQPIGSAPHLLSLASLHGMLAQAKADFTSCCEHSQSLALQILPQARQHAEPKLLSETLHLLGRCEQVLQQTSETLLHLQEASQLAAPDTLGNILELMARCHADQQDASLAMQFWGKALQAAQPFDDRECFVQCFLGVGNLYFQHEHFNEALYYQSQAVDWAELSADADLQAQSQLHLAATLIKCQQFDLAEQLLFRTEDQLQLPARLSWLAEVNHYLGQLYQARGDDLRAEVFFQAAHDINQHTAYHWGQTQSLLSLGRLKIQQGASDAAEHLLTQALALAETHESNQQRLQIHRELSALYEQRGDFIRATMHHIGYHEHYQQQIRQHTRQNLAALSSRRLRQAEIKLRLLRSELEIRQLRQQRHQEQERLERLETAAYRDALTGVYNRRALDEQLPQLIQQLAEQNLPLCLLMIDFDHFKQVNDHYSHQIGDVVLQTGMQLLQGMIRDTDILARFGGEEFVLALPKIHAGQAMQIAERMRRKIADYPWNEVTAGLKVTISLGCAQWHPGMRPAELIQHADLGLYAAKNGGRNRVCLHEDRP
ncbi:diguanylate cyclase [Chitinibacter tainanensis]|uniref:tetratricopeptide repeat-containing diguanylate cyclase n=1 Tax=Chitinibacter tainanensis TaxID=230667 RepID=UPI002353DC64|nr:diguanylate cyclase [Chitinibacter tainanensis]